MALWELLNHKAESRQNWVTHKKQEKHSQKKQEKKNKKNKEATEQSKDKTESLTRNKKNINRTNKNNKGSQRKILCPCRHWWAGQNSSRKLANVDKWHCRNHWATEAKQKVNEHKEQEKHREGTRKTKKPENNLKPCRNWCNGQNCKGKLENVKKKLHHQNN